MKKSRFLCLLLAHSTFGFAMENSGLSSKLFSLYSYVPSFSGWFKQKESSVIMDFRASKNNFEKQLKIDSDCVNNYKLTKEMHEHCLVRIRRKISCLEINCDPAAFLRFCYYQKIHGEYNKLSSLFKNYETVDHFSNNEGDVQYSIAMQEYNQKKLDRLKACQDARIENYSALGAAMIAQDMSFEGRRKFIKELIAYGFEPTLNDKQLAAFILHDAIMAQEQLKNKFMYLLDREASMYWSILPRDVRKKIARCWVEILKKDYWLLPEF